MCFRPADGGGGGPMKCPECGKPIQMMAGIQLKNCPFCKCDFTPYLNGECSRGPRRPRRSWCPCGSWRSWRSEAACGSWCVSNAYINAKVRGVGLGAGAANFFIRARFVCDNVSARTKTNI